MNSNKVNNFSDYVHTRPHPTPQLSQLFTRLNKPLLHASAGDKSLHPALTGSVINHSLTDPRLDWTVCLCSVTLLPWCASRFTPTKSQWQTCTLPRTRVSSLRHLSDGPESRQGPRCPALLPHILALKRLETFLRAELSVTGVAASSKAAPTQEGCVFIDGIWMHRSLLIAPCRLRRAVFIYASFSLLGSFNPAMVLKRVLILDLLILVQ